MLKNVQFWLLTVLGAMCVVVVAVNMLLASNNQALRLRVNERAQLISESTPVASLYRQIVQALAQLSVRDHDPRLQAVLARQGLHVTVRPASAPTGTAPQAPNTSKHGTGGHHG